LRKRIAIAISLDPDTLATVDQMAAAETAGNRSAMVRELVRQRERLQELLAPSKRSQELQIAR
jgi:metal-responsive CopG/Arc/MetJ family transcriptional regulator